MRQCCVGREPSLPRPPPGPPHVRPPPPTVGPSRGARLPGLAAPEGRGGRRPGRRPTSPGRARILRGRTSGAGSRARDVRVRRALLVQRGALRRLSMSGAAAPRAGPPTEPASVPGRFTRAGPAGGRPALDWWVGAPCRVPPEWVGAPCRAPPDRVGAPHRFAFPGAAPARRRLPSGSVPGAGLCPAAGRPVRFGAPHRFAPPGCPRDAPGTPVYPWRPAPSGGVAGRAQPTSSYAS
ncbi:hypothetical protein BKD26_21105 [Streptomyces sp. CB03238]|nr:hypothetical protein BKD26_21105 [Streptomyces sp. CB03238]